MKMDFWKSNSSSTFTPMVGIRLRPFCFAGSLACKNFVSLKILKLLILFVVSCLLMGAVSDDCYAQPPDAGSLLQEERQLTPHLPDRLPEEEAPDVLIPPEPDKGIKISVKDFKFSGRYEQLATEAELQELVKNHLNTRMTFTELQYLAEKITHYLREKKGFLLARAYLPRQDVTEGVVEISIIPGILDSEADIDLQEPFRIKTKVLKKIADKAVPDDAPVRMEDLERAILLMNDLPGISAESSLEPGTETGSTHLTINAAEGSLFQGLLSADNHGSRYTGSARGKGQVSAYNPSGFGDQLGFSFTGAQRSRQWQGSYAMPLGSSGLTGNLSYTNLSYELGKEMSELNAEGSADTMSTSFSYPVLRSRSASIWTGLGGEYMALADRALGTKTRDREIFAGNLKLSGNFFDGVGGGGLTNATVMLTGGDVDLSGLRANEISDSEGPCTQGGFLRLSYSIGRLQRLNTNTSLYVSARGQLAFDNLDSSQKFILGGPSGIRAYPSGEASADEGHSFTVEGRLDLPFMPTWAATQLAGFYDAGWVKLHRNKWPGAINSATGKNSYWISGAGLGLNIGKPGLYTLRATYAHTIGSNPGRSLDGKHSDNTGDDYRFWTQLLIWF